MRLQETMKEFFFNLLMGGWSPNLVHSARRPFIDQLYLPWVIVRMENLVEWIGRGNRSTLRKPAPAPLCPPQIPLEQTQAWTRAAVVGSQRLTAWAMVQPTNKERKIAENVFCSIKYSLMAYRPFARQRPWNKNETAVFVMQWHGRHASTIELLLEMVLCNPLLGSFNSCTTTLETGMFSTWSVQRCYEKENCGNLVSQKLACGEKTRSLVWNGCQPGSC
jgi:hypothetical protein